MYSGIDGRPLNANIFMGVVYYIRLRHMVGDKYQVRSTGPIDQLTHQPVQGELRFWLSFSLPLNLEGKFDLR